MCTHFEMFLAQLTIVGVHNLGLSWCWPQAPLELCLRSRSVCRSLARPNYAQALLDQSKLTKLNKLPFSPYSFEEMEGNTFCLRSLHGCHL